MTTNTAPAIEIVHLKVAPGHEDAFLTERDGMIAAVRAAHPGLVRAQLVDLGDGQWMDLVRWQTIEEAHAAAADFPNIPQAGAWALHIAEVTSMTHGHIAHESV
jgi:L-aminopeptidase/D-esterase-like protein